MSTFKDYLTESTKSYDYKIKVAGTIADDFASRMETALQKFELAKLSAGKKTPIMTLPLDFPALSNESVTIFDVTTNYPASSNVMKEYLSDILRVPATHIVVRKPGEPTEEYQDAMQIGKKSDFANKLADVEMKFQDNAPNQKVKADDLSGDKYNMGLLRELMKTKGDTGLDKTEKTQDQVPNEDDTKTGSPIHTGKAPIKGNPDPIEHYKFKSIGAKA